MTTVLPRQPGIYLVTLSNTELLSVNADRPRIAERCIKVNYKHCKVGKAIDLAARKKNYDKTFGAHNVTFEVLAIVDNPEFHELAILETLGPHRIRGATGRPNEWLEGISPDDVRLKVAQALKRALNPAGQDVARSRDD